MPKALFKQHKSLIEQQMQWSYLLSPAKKPIKTENYETNKNYYYYRSTR